jgi:hypothetical protein
VKSAVEILVYDRPKGLLEPILVVLKSFRAESILLVSNLTDKLFGYPDSYMAKLAVGSSCINVSHLVT